MSRLALLEWEAELGLLENALCGIETANVWHRPGSWHIRLGGLAVVYDQAERWVKDYLVDGAGRSSYHLGLSLPP